MNPREIDALVAQARGWTLKKYANGGGEWTHNGMIMAYRHGLRWSTDIAEAMGLVDRPVTMTRLSDGKWSVNFTGEWYVAFADTLQEAICLAYLKAKGINVEVEA